MNLHNDGYADVYVRAEGESWEQTFQITSSVKLDAAIDAARKEQP
jgi:hypothetical protein